MVIRKFGSNKNNMITVTFYGSLTQEFARLNFYLEVLASLHRVIYFSWNQSWMAMSLKDIKNSEHAALRYVSELFSFSQVCHEFPKGCCPRDHEVREHIPVPYDNLFQSILSCASRSQSYF